MSTTEKGWTTQWPKVDDTFYWMRYRDGRYRDLPVHVSGINVMCLFDHSYSQRGNIEGEVEFLGPISPSDFEQLIRLRETTIVSQKLIDAVFYALREGCFFPVPEPRQGATVQELIQWGAMRHLHDAIAEYNREKQSKDREALAHREGEKS